MSCRCFLFLVLYLYFEWIKPILGISELEVYHVKIVIIGCKLFICISLCPQLRSWVGILVWGCPCMHPFVTLFDACHILWTVHAKVLKFHILIPHGKIADTHFFSCPSYLPFWNNAPLKISEWNLMHAISFYEPCMLGFWNFIYGFLMEK